MRRSALPLVLLLVAVLAVPAAASPQPTPVCQLCGSAFENAAGEAGADATVTNSTVLVQVHDDGSATWTVRNRLADATPFREDSALLNRTARRLIDGQYGHPEGGTLVSARTDGDVVVLTVRDDDAATRRAGLLVVDYLHDEGYEPWYHVNADRFTIRGPADTVVTNTPDSGTVDGRSVAWDGNTGGELYESADLEGSPYVVFGPDDTTATQIRTAAAVALATAPIVFRGVQSFLVWQTALFALALAGVVALLRSRPRSVAVNRLAAALVLLGALGAAVPAFTHGPGWVTGPPLLAVGVGLLALTPRTRALLRTARGQMLAALGVLAGSFALLVGVHAVTAPSRVTPAALALRATALAFPLAAMLPLGAVLDAARGRLLRWGALAVVAFAAVPVAVVGLVDPPGGLAGGLYALFLFGAAVVGPLLGALLIVLGRSLVSREADDDRRSAATASSGRFK